MQTWIALKTGREDPHSKVGENRYINNNEYFWALKNISIDIKQGDRIGIIGKNGAGKSTLLKLLSQITSPTKGTIKIRGKIASLLEVGTGFHRELTGRENIYLNGAILGMKRKQIAKKLDEIINFSGIEHHIDTPVKRYSSGMYVRLAFAVAAHLDSDILIADEVLAVGDSEFQMKAIGKMHDLSADSGRTVLFVSHNIGAVRSLCNYGVFLNNGVIEYTGKIESTIENYMKSGDILHTQSEKCYVPDDSKPFQVTKVEIVNKNYIQLSAYEAQEEIAIRLHCISREPIPNLYGYFALKREDGDSLIACDSTEGRDVFNNLPVGKYFIDLTIPAGLLAPGCYIPFLNFTSHFSTKFDIDSPLDILKFKVIDSISKRGNNRGSLTALVLDWNLLNNINKH
jgi:lipopolysaccharide transport system ATP-binding protein